MGDKVVTLSEVKDLIKAEGLKPSDLFGQEVLAVDPVVQGYVDSEKKAAVAGEYAHRKREESSWIEDKKKLEDQLKEKDAVIVDLRKVASGPQLEKILDAAAEKKELTDQQLKYLKRGIPKFKVEDPDKLEKEFEAYLESELNVFEDLQKEVFGEGDPGAGDDKEKEIKPGGGPSKAKGGSGDGKDAEDYYTKPLE